MSWLTSLESKLHSHRVVVRRGGQFDRWDLEVWCGLLAGSRVLMTIEEHGWGKQLLRFRVWPRVERMALFMSCFIALLTVAAARDGAWTASLVLTLCVLLGAVRTIRECTAAINSVVESVHAWSAVKQRSPAVPVEKAEAAKANLQESAQEPQPEVPSRAVQPATEVVA